MAWTFSADFELRDGIEHFDHPAADRHSELIQVKSHFGKQARRTAGARVRQDDWLHVVNHIRRATAGKDGVRNAETEFTEVGMLCDPEKNSAVAFGWGLGSCRAG